MPRTDREWICKNKLCERYDRVQVRVFDCLDEISCKYCHQSESFKRFVRTRTNVRSSSPMKMR